jgi:hypothetical protein
MKVQFIYTFEETPQIITEYNDLFPVFMGSKNLFLSYAMSGLDKIQRQTLIKISCCISDAYNFDCPQWYSDINGKFWVDDLEVWRHENGIKSMVSKDFINEFTEANS